MKMTRQICCLIVYGLALLNVFADAPRAAVVYSDWAKSTFSSEYDKHLKALGWAFDKFQNTRLPELTEKLGAYQFIIAASVANYTQTVTMGPYADAWRKWLEGGGALIITDANYGSVLGTWVGAFGPEFACGCASCSAHTKPSDETRALTVHPDPLADCPKPLSRIICDNYHQWTHLTKLDAAWRKPVTCADGAPILAYRRWGKGLVVLTSAASLKNNPIARALLENVAAHRKLREKGVEIVSFEPNLDGGSPGRRVARIRMKVEPGRVREISATLSAHNTDWKGASATAKETASVSVPANGEVTLEVACTVVRSGKVESKLELRADGGTLLSCDWTETTPRTVGLKLKRKHLYPGNALVARMTFAEPGRAAARTSLEGAAWQIDGGAWQMREVKDGDWTIPVEGLSPGAHVFRAKLRYKPGFLESLDRLERNLLDWGEGEEASFFTHPEPKYRMRDDHVLLENGQPFFPFGFYNVSWTIPAEERLAMVRDVAKWGYNAVHVGMRNDEYDGDGYGAFLDACAKLGIRVITEFDVGRAESVIRKYRGKAAVMGWNPGDEPAPKGITPQEMFRRYDTFKQIDPDHIAYTVICVPSQYANYAAGTDVLAPDPYPVPRRPVDDVYRRFKEAKAAANKVDTALWAVGQAFGGQKYDKKGSWPRWPDPREFRGMSYLALMAGAKGIIYYTYYDGSFDIRQAPDLLEAVQKFPAEMRDMVPFILDGKGELLAEDVDGVYAMVWTLGAERRLVVVNAREKETKVELPFAGARVLHGTPQGLKAAGGKVCFTLAPLERVVLGQ